MIRRPEMLSDDGRMPLDWGRLRSGRAPTSSMPPMACVTALLCRCARVGWRQMVPIGRPLVDSRPPVTRCARARRLLRNQ